LLQPPPSLTVLVDAGTQGMQRLHDIATKGLLATSRLVTVAEVTGFENADIEDVSGHVP